MKNYKNKKGVSQLVITAIMIALVMGMTLVLFNVVSNLLNDKTESAESCFGNFDEVTVNKKSTCKNFSSDELQFFVNVGDVNIDSLLVSLSSGTEAKSFELKGGSILFVKTYGGVWNELVSPPGKNSGATYVVDLNQIGILNVSSLTIAPKIRGSQCEVSDSLLQIDDCRLLA